MAVKVKHIRRKSQAELNQVPVKDGQLLYNSVSGQTFIDIGNKRITNSPIAIFAPEAGNTAKQNSELLQKLIDEASAKKGGTIYIPAGTYEFGATGTAQYSSNQQYCVKMKSNVHIIGDGATTILKPTGVTLHGLDMFYENTYRETETEHYTENCIFENFVVDATNTSTQEYKTAGKAFMMNLIRNCHWKNIIIKNTDGTGLGVDCPIACSIVNCIATGCGKAAPSNGHGASGIGIGVGYSEKECMIIMNCISENNANFGIFYEHQRRFKPWLYKAKTNKGFFIVNCSCSNNHDNYGLERMINGHIINCYSSHAKFHGYLITNAELCDIKSCVSNVETDGSFVIKTVDNEPNEETAGCKDIAVSGNISKFCKSAIKLYRAPSATATMDRISIISNTIFAVKSYAFDTYGVINSLMVSANMSDKQSNTLQATGSNHISKGNSWNT